MKKKTLLSIILIVVLMATAISIPAFAAYSNTFQLAGRIVLPGNDTAPEGGLIVVLEYRTDKGTTDASDDSVTPIIIQMSAGSRETYFSVNMEKTNPGAKYSLSYTVASSSKYWDRGYYSVSGMHYYKAGQSLFDEGTVIAGLVITPLNASKISGSVAIPAYTASQGAIEVDVVAETAGALSSQDDDYKAEAKLQITNASAAYSIKVPTTGSNAGYTVKYKTTGADYVENGWYSTTGTVLAADQASKIDVSNGDRTDINIGLIKKTSAFKLEGKVALPGTDTAPAGGLIVTLEYRSDKGTPSITSDDVVTHIAVPLAQGVHEAAFSTDIPYTASGAKYALSYSVPSSSQYWEKGYYHLNGMQYFKDGQLFTEGTILSNLVITPVRASVITGTVGLPTYTTTQGAVQVEVKAKTTGTLTSNIDDYFVTTNVSVTTAAAAYSLKVPATLASAGYTVMYSTKNALYEKNGWYGTNGTVLKAEEAARVDVSAGNPTGINLTLVAAKVPEVPADINFDLNKDGKVDVKDMIMVARAMGARHKYVKALDLNLDGVINVKDLNLIKSKIEKLVGKNHKAWERGYDKNWKKVLGADWQKYMDQDWFKYIEAGYAWNDDNDGRSKNWKCKKK